MKRELKLTGLLESPKFPKAVADAALAHIPTPDEAVVYRRSIEDKPSELRRGSRTAVQWITTRDVDREQEILDPEGAVLDDFLLAPVVLVNHNYSKLPVGIDKRLICDDYGIRAHTRYGTTQRAQEVFTLKQEEILTTQSVGFVPIECIDKGKRGWAEAVESRVEKWGIEPASVEGARRLHTKWLLLEHSDVSVPSNIHARQILVSKGLDISSETLEELDLELGVRYGSADGSVWQSWDPIPNRKPYPSEHSCELVSGDFDSYRSGARTADNGKRYRVILGIKNKKTTEIAYRYPKNIWAAAEARSHCKSHDGRFVAAASEHTARVISVVSSPKTIRACRLAHEDMRHTESTAMGKATRTSEIVQQVIERLRGRV